MLKNKKGFTLIELIVIIVIVGILAAVAIPSYVNLTTDATNATARGILGGLRGANALLFASRLIGSGATTATYTIGDVVASANVQGVQSTGLGATTYTFYLGALSFVINMPVGAAPTTLPTVFCAANPTW